MKARQLFERMAPAPVEAPPKPGVKPEAPPAPSRPAPTRFPNPFRRRRSPGVHPGPMPKPKACESKAKQLFGEGFNDAPNKYKVKKERPKAKDLFRVEPKRFNREDAIKHGRAKPLPDDPFQK